MLVATTNSITLETSKQKNMAKETLVFEVTDASYGKYVLLNSHKIPVVMLFMGVWSEYCYAMDSLFSRLAEEFAEQFVFAKLDIEESPDARQKYEVNNVPTLVIFKNGEEVRREEGQLDEDEARALLKDLAIFRESDVQRMQARSAHMQGKTPQAITMLAEAMKSDPGNTRIAMDMVQIFIDLEQINEAEALFSKLPEADRETTTGKGLKGQLESHRYVATTDGVDSLMRRIEQNEDDFDAHFDLAICLTAKNDYAEAMNHLFFLLQRQPDYRGGAPREMIVSLINSMSENSPQVAQLYRRQLASLLNE